MKHPTPTRPIPNRNMGRVQVARPGWSDSGSVDPGSDWRRGNEAADRELREAHGRPLPAAYRYILGPTPTLLPGDRTGARNFLNLIDKAVEHGGWTRSEWTRLRRLRATWRSRSEGTDARYREVGNRKTGLTDYQTANVRERATIEKMKKAFDDTCKRTGD